MINQRLVATSSSLITIQHLINNTLGASMPDSISAITNIQKLIKQLQKDALQQIQKTHAEPLSKVHQIMRENGLTIEMVALSLKARKQRSKKTEAETRPILKLPAAQK